VPFLLRLPEGRAAGTVLPGPAEQIDVAPTLLALAGIEAPADWPGRNLLADLDDAGRGAVARPSFAWLARNALVNRAVTRAQWKLIHHEQRAGVRATPLFELFALGSDPGERASLARARPLRRRWLEGQLAAALFAYRSEFGADRAVLDPELEADLRALGYL
jgi:arylsulfatase A-like enzyme